MGASRLAARLGVPAVARVAPATRSLSISVVRANEDTFRRGKAPFEEAHSIEFINYLLDQPVETTHEALVERLTDDEIALLPFVITNRRWGPLRDPFTLPRRLEVDQSEEGDRPLKNAEFVYRTFKVNSMLHLKRLNTEIAAQVEVEGRHSAFSPVMLIDPQSRTLTVGLPAYVGIQAPYPAKDNVEQVKVQLREYRAESTSPEKKKGIANELRALVVPRGFTFPYIRFARFLNSLWESVRSLDQKQLFNKETRFDSRGYIVDASATDAAARSPVTRRSRNPDAAPRQKRNRSLADKLRADDRKLPEAGTFVAQDGDVHKPDADEALEEHVPFPKPAPEEMGMKTLPTAGDKLKADDPKLPEAGTFVAQDGDVHKPDANEALEEHVPFPKPTPEEMGVKKPTEPSS
ncbi:uncharacterized protein PSANT_02252 [Moesziomyces antarcticus]|nr:uncharacterized protein PSANT_02252 [Moesziomyces antarcticus]